MKERPKEIMTIMLIGINILVFIVLTMIGRTEDGYFMLQHGAMYEPYIIENQEYYRLFTSLFLHFGISHLLNNMVLLWALGSIFEKEAGKTKKYYDQTRPYGERIWTDNHRVYLVDQ